MGFSVVEDLGGANVSSLDLFESPNLILVQLQKTTFD